MDTFGDRLRSERESRGLSIESLAETLGVEAGRLGALEQNDFGVLPDEATMLDCLRGYAAALEVDAELMIEDYLHERSRCLQRLEAALPELPEDEPRRGRLVAVVFTAAVALLGGWWLLKGREAPPPPQFVPREHPLPAPAPSATAASVATAVSLDVVEHGTGSGISDRRLIGEASQFHEGRQVYFWTRVEGGSNGENIDHVWLHDGSEEARMTLTLGGSNWRTYSYKTLQSGSAGDWAVEARDSAGQLLARREFRCVP